RKDVLHRSGEGGRNSTWNSNIVSDPKVIGSDCDYPPVAKSIDGVARSHRHVSSGFEVDAKERLIVAVSEYVRDGSPRNPKGARLKAGNFDVLYVDGLIFVSAIVVRINQVRHRRRLNLPSAANEDGTVTGDTKQCGRKVDLLRDVLRFIETAEFRIRGG